jgi:hypothetical protein
VIHGDLAVNDHEWDACWKLARIIVCGVVDDPFSVEHNDVCVMPLLDSSAFCQTKSLRRTVGHPVNHLLQAQDVELSAKSPQKSGERSE